MNTDNVKKLAVLNKSRKYLSTTLAFPSDEEIANINDDGYVNRSFVIGLIVSVYYPFGIIIHMIINVKNKTFAYLDRDLGCLLAYFGTAYFETLYVYHENYLIQVYKQCSDFESFGKPANFDRINKILDKFATVYTIYHSGFMTFMNFNTFMFIKQCKAMNVHQNVSEVCGLIASTWLPFEYDFFPMKHIIFVYQALVVYFTVNNAGIISYVMMETVENVVIRFNHVAEKFCEVVEESDAKKRREKFTKAVRYHIDILEMAALVKECLSASMMTHITLSGPVLGTSFFRIITEHHLDSICLCFTWIISTLLVCTAGQRLADASENIGSILYQTEWYNVEPKLQSDMNFLMMRCTKPIYLRAGPFGYMNNAMFMLIAKTSYTYMTLLLQEM